MYCKLKYYWSLTKYGENKYCLNNRVFENSLLWNSKSIVWKWHRSCIVIFCPLLYPKISHIWSRICLVSGIIPNSVAFHPYSVWWTPPANLLEYLHSSISNFPWMSYAPVKGVDTSFQTPSSPCLKNYSFTQTLLRFVDLKSIIRRPVKLFNLSITGMFHNFELSFI